MTYQLQLWTGKAYEPVADSMNQRELYDAKDRANAKAWRIVDTRKDRPLKPKYTRPRVSTATTKYTAATVAGAYFAWAKSKGLTSVAVYDDVRLTYNGPKPTHWQGIALRYVNAADFLGDAPAPEEDET